MLAVPRQLKSESKSLPGMKGGSNSDEDKKIYEYPWMMFAKGRRAWKRGS